jgi:hypothetical protein
MDQTYFRRGLGLKKEIEPVLAAEYHSGLVEQIRGSGYVAAFGDLTVRLARDFGFCYGVDRAVDYAYQALQVPDRRIFLVGEIIHNPHGPAAARVGSRSCTRRARATSIYQLTPTTWSYWPSALPWLTSSGCAIGCIWSTRPAALC